ncbi:MAG TPA: tetratricopeptide repeat protein [Saprospiraceae bacterium]|nr:tetratricopeptide repeat protein [Saprospiraceae bacterium]HMP12655.1 tetratricopeptide repeat protein [Saprospiraceae bacterium]
MKLLRILIATLLAGSLNVSAQAQCGTWNNLPNQDDLIGAHSVYRQYLKDKQLADIEQLGAEDFKIAFENWKKTYDASPAADGQRATHYVDGRTFHMVLHNKTQDAAKQKEHADMILRLYDEQIQCYKNEAFLLGRKAYDMFYYLPSYGFSLETYSMFKKAIEKGGNNTEYIVFDPVGQLVTYWYKQGKISKAEAIEMSEKLTAIAEHNIKNNKQYGQYYEQALAVMENNYAPIADEVFDCEYFKKKLVPSFKANPDDIEVVKYVYNKLKAQGCDSTDVTMNELRTKYEALATEINARLEAELRQNNPGYDASLLQREGKYEQAVTRYREAIEKETDNDKKAQFYYSIAYIQTWQFGQYSSARENARRAASLKSGWGRPYILIGDMYARTSRDCGDDWNTRLAILAAIEKYSYAKSIDSEVNSDANERIGRYSSSLPELGEGHMRGMKPGDKATVGCWISETVTLRFKS